MKVRGRFLAGAAALGLAAWLAWSFRPQPVPAELGTVSRGPLMVTIDEDARARVVDRFVIHAPVAGDLARPGLEPGDAVEAGDVGGRIVPRSAPLLDPRERREAQARVQAARAELDAQRSRGRGAQADLELARRELARVQALADAGEAPARELDAASYGERAAAAEAESAGFGEQVAAFQLEQAESALQGGRAGGTAVEVRSPVAARVLAVPEEDEGAVEAGAHLVELGDPRRMEVVVDVLSSEAVTIAAGARVVLEDWGGEPLEGRVRLVEPAAVTKVSALGIEEQRVDVVVDIASPRQEWATLGDGYALQARIVTWESNDALLVPATALFRTGDAWSAFVVRDGRARLVPVQAGRRTGLLAEALAGLTEGDRVIVHPSDAVQDGVRVRERPTGR